MEQLTTEHGGILVSAIVSIISIVLICIVVVSVSNMDAYALTSIIGE